MDETLLHRTTTRARGPARRHKPTAQQPASEPDSGESWWCFLDDSGEEQGPFTTAKLVSWLPMLTVHRLVRPAQSGAEFQPIAHWEQLTAALPEQPPLRRSMSLPDLTPPPHPSSSSNSYDVLHRSSASVETPALATTSPAPAPAPAPSPPRPFLTTHRRSKSAQSSPFRCTSSGGRGAAAAVAASGRAPTIIELKKRSRSTIVGVTLEQARGGGVVVSQIAPGGLAAGSLVVGDVLVALWARPPRYTEWKPIYDGGCLNDAHAAAAALRTTNGRLQLAVVHGLTGSCREHALARQRRSGRRRPSLKLSWSSSATSATSAAFPAAPTPPSSAGAASASPGPSGARLSYGSKLDAMLRSLLAKHLSGLDIDAAEQPPPASKAASGGWAGGCNVRERTESPVEMAFEEFMAGIRHDGPSVQAPVQFSALL